jgi:cell division protein FtsB
MTIGEMTDGEIRREIAKHVASLDSLNADTNALKMRLEDYKTELDTRLESRRKPLTSTASGRGVYRSTLEG